MIWKTISYNSIIIFQYRTMKHLFTFAFLTCITLLFSCNKSDDYEIVEKLPLMNLTLYSIDSLEYTEGDKSIFLNNSENEIGTFSAQVYDSVFVFARIKLPGGDFSNFSINGVPSYIADGVCVFNGCTDATVTVGDSKERVRTTVIGWIKQIKKAGGVYEGKISFKYEAGGKKYRYHIARITKIDF